MISSSVSMLCLHGMIFTQNTVVSSSPSTSLSSEFMPSSPRCQRTCSIHCHAEMSPAPSSHFNWIICWTVIKHRLYLCKEAWFHYYLGILMMTYRSALHSHVCTFAIFTPQCNHSILYFLQYFHLPIVFNFWLCLPPASSCMVYLFCNHVKEICFGSLWEICPTIFFLQKQLFQQNLRHLLIPLGRFFTPHIKLQISLIRAFSMSQRIGMDNFWRQIVLQCKIFIVLNAEFIFYEVPDKRLCGVSCAVATVSCSLPGMLTVHPCYLPISQLATLSWLWVVYGAAMPLPLYLIVLGQVAQHRGHILPWVP